MKRKPKCECGKCETCRKREYMRKYMKKRTTKKARRESKDYKRLKKFDPVEIEERASRIIRRAKSFGPQFIEVIDNTGLGLEVSFCRRAKTLMVSVSLLERKPQEVTKIEIRKIRESPSTGDMDTD